VYAFIKEKECSKEEKTRGKSREIAQISCFVSMLVLTRSPRQKTQDMNRRLKKNF